MRAISVASAVANRPMNAVRVALLLLVLAGGSLFAPAAIAQPGGPFTPGLPPLTGTAPSPTTPTASTPTATSASPTTTSGGSGPSGSGVAAIAIGALAVLGGISFFIWRDARRRAPVRSRPATADGGAPGRSGSRPRPKPRKLSPVERRRRKRGRAR